MDYWPGELVYYSIPLFIAILAIYFFHKKQAETLKLKTLVDEMKGRVECQVCLALPRQGPVPMCPNGHFICSPCKARNGQEGKTNCPTCRQPLGEIRSLLARILIENVLHECDLEGCGQKVAHNDYKRHQDRCDYRLVRK